MLLKHRAINGHSEGTKVHRNSGEMTPAEMWSHTAHHLETELCPGQRVG